MSSYLDWPRYSRLTWIGAALLVLVLLLLWLAGHGPGATGRCCSQNPFVSVPAPVVPSAAKPVAGDLHLLYHGGRFTLTGVVPDQATHDRVVQSATATYGADNIVDHLKIDAVVAGTCIARQDALFTWLKSGFRSGVSCGSDGVTLTGVVASDAEKVAREQSARDLFGAGAMINDKLLVIAPLSTVARVEDVKCGGSIAATITFASDSADIDAAGKPLLDAIAPCLKDGAYEVGGHTDASGNDEINLPLSQQRADAVRNYLVGKGADAAQLSAVGYGAERPIADNTTEEGKARNRRIEFTRK